MNYTGHTFNLPLSYHRSIKRVTFNNAVCFAVIWSKVRVAKQISYLFTLSSKTIDKESSYESSFSRRSGGVGLIGLHTLFSSCPTPCGGLTGPNIIIISFVSMHIIQTPLSTYTHIITSMIHATESEETSTYSSLGFCTVNCRPTASNYQLSHMRNRTPASEVGGKSVTTLPPWPPGHSLKQET